VRWILWWSFWILWRDLLSGLVARLQRLPETELENGPSSPNAPQKTIWRIFTHLWGFDHLRPFWTETVTGKPSKHQISELKDKLWQTAHLRSATASKTSCMQISGENLAVSEHGVPHHFHSFPL
jgi:hypothetical protein